MIETLKKVKQLFEISVATFEFGRNIIELLGNKMEESEMEKLHKKILTQLRQKNVTVQDVDSLLAEMEKLADENKKQRFENGGVFSNQNKLLNKNNND